MCFVSLAHPSCALVPALLAAGELVRASPVGSTVSTPYGISGFVDNLLFLRFVEDRGRVRRLLTITKMRDTDFDSGLHAIDIGRAGMRIAGLFSSDGDVIPSAEPVEPPRVADAGVSGGASQKS
jgi:hypothetical protein